LVTCCFISFGYLDRHLQKQNGEIPLGQSDAFDIFIYFFLVGLHVLQVFSIITICAGKLDKVSIPPQGVHRIWDWQNGEMMFYEEMTLMFCMLKECSKCTM
jgi:hypothetical protein